MMTLQRILCPIDFSESSRRALHYAKALSIWYEAPLTVVHVCVDLPVFEMASPFGHTAATALVLEQAQLAERRAAVHRFVTSAGVGDSTEILVSEGIDAKAEITFTTTSYEGLGQIVAKDKSGTTLKGSSALSGKRVGDC